MQRITTALPRIVATAVLRRRWNIQSAAARTQARGERTEARAHRLAVRWRCVDDMLAIVTTEALSSR
jgi:hypothetical protein